MNKKKSVHRSVQTKKTVEDRRVLNKNQSAFVLLGSKIDSLAELMNQKFEKADSRMDSLNQKIDDINTTFNQKIEATAAQLEQKIEATAAQLDQKIEARATRLDKKNEATSARLDQKIDSAVDRLDRKIDNVALVVIQNTERLDRIESTMSTKADIDKILNRMDHFSKEMMLLNSELRLQTIHIQETKAIVDNHEQRIKKLESAA